MTRVNPHVLKPISVQRLRWAYLCYTWIACAIWFETAVEALPLASDYRQFIFMVLWLPVTLSIVGATLIAFTYSAQEWKEWPLLVMAAVVVTMGFAFLAVDVRGMGSKELDLIWYAQGAAFLLLLGLWGYFTRARQT